MARIQQDILVKIKVLLEGLGNVRALAGHIKELNGGGGGKVGALTGDLNKLSAAVDRLAASQEKAGKSGGGFVRFLVGVSAVVSTLASLPQAFVGLDKLLDFLDNIGGGVGAAFGKVKDFFSSLFSSISQLAGGVVSRAGSAVGGLGGAVGGLGAALGAALPLLLAVGAALAVVAAALAAAGAAFVGLAAAVGLGALALTKIAPAGIAANKQLERVRLGIAAVITSLALLNAGGVKLDGAQKFGAAMALAREQVAKLRVDAVNTTATFEQIAPAFQAAIAPGLAARLTLDQIREITVKVVQAASAIGLPLEQVNQEVRAILDGTINEDARLAKVLGISNEMVKSWKAQGTLAEELNKRLEGFATAGEEAAQTLEGLESNLQEALNVFNQEATTRTFAALKDEFKRLLPQLFDFKNAGIQAQFKELAALADDVLVRIVRLGGQIAQGVVSGLRRAADFVSQNRSLINDVLNVVGLVLRQLLSIAGIFVRVGTNTSVWKGVLGAAHSVLLLISAILGTIENQLRQIAPLLQLVAAAAVLAIQSNSTLAALSAGSTAKTSGQVATETAEQASGALGALQGALTTASPPPPGAPSGGKGGGGGRQSRIPQLTRALDSAKIDTALARLQAKSELIRQDIEASVQAVKDGLEDSILSIGEAYRLEAALADKALQAERERIREEINAAKQRRDLAVKDLDPDSKGKERQLAIAAEDEKLTAEVVRLEGERARLVEEIADKKAALVREEAQAQEAFRRTLDDIQNELDGLAPSAALRIEAAAAEIEERFRETRKKLEAEARAGGATAATELEKLGKLIDGLSARAKFDILADGADSKLGELRDLEELLSIGVSQGTIKSRDAAKRRLELEREYKRALLDTIEGLAEIARRTGDPELAAAVRKLQIEWSKLGVVINETAKRLDDTLRGGLEDTLASIITRTETVGEAFRKLAQTILAEIARILAANFVEKLFGGVLNTGGGNSIGNILASILGRGTPKTSGTPTPAGSGIENIPLIIKNFQSGAVGGLRNVNQSTKGVSDVTTRGFGQVNASFGTAIGLLGNIVSVQAAQAAAAVAAAGTAIFKILAGGGGANHATGGFEAAAPGGRLIRVAEAGFDEVILTTDPRYRGRTSKLLGQFLRRTGLAPDFGAVVLEGALAGVPSFGAGGFALSDINPPASVGGDTFNVKTPVIINAKDVQSFRGSEQVIKRDIARAVQEGIRRVQSRPR